VDGTRDRPPGKSAENWSRRDGIRAGSVSGPWRSAPREAGAQPFAVEPPAAPHAPSRPPAAPPPTSRTLSLGSWIAFGVLLGGALVVAAVYLRPDTPAPQPAPEEAIVAPAQNEAPPPAADDPALVGISVVRLRVGPDFPEEREAAIRAALASAGISGVRVEVLPDGVATSRVGYYRPEDLAAAEALVRLVTPVLSESIGVRDYGKLLADPEPGRLELWVES
jgi:hypothetical protein